MCLLFIIVKETHVTTCSQILRDGVLFRFFLPYFPRVWILLYKKNLSLPESFPPSESGEIDTTGGPSWSSLR